MGQLYVLPPEATDPAATVATVGAARADPGLVVLEGAHALKHAVRFGARLELVASPDPDALRRLLGELAPDVVVPVGVQALPRAAWRRATRELPSPALAVARRPGVTAEQVLAAEGRVVVLDRPRHLGNLGAVVRVAAAAGAGGVLVVGDADPWHPTAVRAAAGLQFALPVARTDDLPPVSDRPLVALDAGGEPLRRGMLDPSAVVVVGTERHGLSAPLRARAARTLAIPMRDGVSSLNLATAVAAALYGG